jgi:membrane carboxypeptidase/penicillin-binding protein
VVNAFLATEDARFFEHGGVDAIGIGRALLSFASTGTKAQGGSTITMQVTRNFLLSSEKTFQRKLAEVLLTLQVERTLTKDQILDLYLNQIFFGHRAYGISAAAALYYDKELDQLTPAEAAMLAGIPKAPSSNNPVTNPERALERRNYILSRMLELGQIDREEYEIAVLTPDMARLHRRQPDLDAGYVAEMARQTVVQHYGEEALSQGLRVTTTIDSRLQSAAQAAVRRALRDYDRRHGYRGAEAKIDLDGATEADMDAYLETVTTDPGPDARVGHARLQRRGGGLYRLRASRRAGPQAGGLGTGVPQRELARPPAETGDGCPRGRAISFDSNTTGEGAGQDGEGRWELGQMPSVAGALVSIAPQDGAVRALVGGLFVQREQVQPGGRHAPSARLELQALHLRRGASRGLDTGESDQGRGGEADRRPGLEPAQLRSQGDGADPDAACLGAFAQPGRHQSAAERRFGGRSKLHPRIRIRSRCHALGPVHGAGDRRDVADEAGRRLCRFRQRRLPCDALFHPTHRERRRADPLRVAGTAILLGLLVPLRR